MLGRRSKRRFQSGRVGFSYTARFGEVGAGVPDWLVLPRVLGEVGVGWVGGYGLVEPPRRDAFGGWLVPPHRPHTSAYPHP